MIDFLFTVNGRDSSWTHTEMASHKNTFQTDILVPFPEHNMLLNSNTAEKKYGKMKTNKGTHAAATRGQARKA